MRNRSKLNVLFRWHGFVSGRVDDTRPSKKIELKLEKETDPDMIWSLKFFLAMHMKSRRLYSESEKIYIDLNRAQPLNPRPLLSLSQQYLYHENDPGKALATNEEAVKLAFQSGHFRREALGVNIRIALQLERFDLVERDMERIISLQHHKGEMDVMVEGDFLKRIPPGKVSDSVKEKYIELCKSRG